MQDFLEITLQGANTVSAVRRLYEDMQCAYEDQYTDYPGSSARLFRQQPPYELHLTEPGTATMQKIILTCTVMSPKETSEQFYRDLAARYTCEIPLSSLQIPVKPDPVTHARIK